MYATRNRTDNSRNDCPVYHASNMAFTIINQSNQQERTMRNIAEFFRVVLAGTCLMMASIALAPFALIDYGLRKKVREVLGL